MLKCAKMVQIWRFMLVYNKMGSLHWPRKMQKGNWRKKMPPSDCINCCTRKFGMNSINHHFSFRDSSWLLVINWFVIGSTVVCILVGIKSFPRFWRNHPYCRNKWYLVWTGCLFSLRWRKKKFFFEKEIQNGQLKKAHFPGPPILNIFSWKFHGLVLGIVELIDAKGIDVAQPIWLWGCLT